MKINRLLIKFFIVLSISFNAISEDIEFLVDLDDPLEELLNEFNEYDDESKSDPFIEMNKAENYRINFSDTPLHMTDTLVKQMSQIKEDIDQSNFKLSQVKNLFFFPSGRWDIETHQGILIKLPIFKVKESLNLYLELLNKDDFKNIKIIDLRQNNQVITNE